MNLSKKSQSSWTEMTIKEIKKILQGMMQIILGCKGIKTSKTP